MDLVQILCLLGFLALYVDGLRFHLPDNGKKCLKEEIHKNVLVTGEYEVSRADTQQVNIKVCLSNCHIKPTFCTGLYLFINANNGYPPVASIWTAFWIFVGHVQNY